MVRFIILFDLFDTFVFSVEIFFSDDGDFRSSRDLSIRLF